jgi:hypothetical protein
LFFFSLILLVFISVLSRFQLFSPARYFANFVLTALSLPLQLVAVILLAFLGELQRDIVADYACILAVFDHAYSS